MTWLIVGVLVGVVLAIVAVIYGALVVAARSDALHRAIYGGDDDGDS